MQRDPHKRRVKLVQKHLVQVDFDVGDSDEDSDFDIGQHHDQGTLISVLLIDTASLFHIEVSVALEPQL